MTEKAIIFIDAPSEDGSEIPRSMILVAGVPLLERQLRQLRAAGIQNVLLLSRHYPEYLHERLGAFKGGPEHVEVLDAEFLGKSLLEEGEMALVLEEGVLLDREILKACHEAEGSVLAWFLGDVVRYGATAGLKISSGDRHGLFASCTKINSAQMREAQESPTFQNSPLRVLLGIVLADADCQWLEVTSLGNDATLSKRTTQTILWRPVLSRDDSTLAGRALLTHYAGSDGDFPDRFIYDLPASPLTLAISKWRFPLSTIRSLTFGLGLMVVALFYWGYLGVGLAGALLFGLLAAIELKLKRLNDRSDQTASLFRQLLDSMEFLWYLAMAYALWSLEQNPLPWALVILIILFAFACLEQKHLEKKINISNAGRLNAGDRFILLFGASRNMRIWLLVPFALAGIILAGLWTLAIYTAISFFVAQRKTFSRLTRTD